MEEHSIKQPVLKVTYLNPLKQTDVDELYNELKNITLRICYSRSNSGIGRTQAFGIINKRGKGPGPARNNTRHPKLYELLMSLGKNMNLDFDGIQLNHNYQSEPHIDKNNLGESVIVSFGDYKGGELVIENVEVNTYLQPVLFDGSKYKHWNNPILPNLNEVPCKYSLVFFKNNKVRQEKYFPK